MIGRDQAARRRGRPMRRDAHAQQAAGQARPAPRPARRDRQAPGLVARPGLLRPKANVQGDGRKKKRPQSPGRQQGARPGARRGTIENYLKRLGDLEKIAMEFPGVKNAYAISAGRELRIFVTPEKIDDFRALELAREVADKIQSELKYPGEIKVNVIREIRAVEYAR